MILDKTILRVLKYNHKNKIKSEMLLVLQHLVSYTVTANILTLYSDSTVDILSNATMIITFQPEDIEQVQVFLEALDETLKNL